MKIKCSVKSKYKQRRLTGIRNGIKEAITRGVTDGGETIKEMAISNVSVNSGELKDSISFEILESDGATVKGAITTGALPQALTLEYGTGEKAETFTTAENIPWAVHESQISKDMSRYNFDTRETRQGKFYIIYGAAAHPYMRPAFKNGTDYTVNAVAAEVNEEIRRTI